MPISQQPQKQQDFCMILPLPVSNNAMYVPVNGRVVLSKTVREYYATMYNLLQGEGIVPLEGRLCVELWIHEPDKRRRDINNMTKSLFDALQRCKVYHDDSQIDETHIYRADIVKDGEIKVFITKIKDEDDRMTVKEQEVEKNKTEKFDNKLSLLESICKKSEIKKVSRYHRKPNIPENL